MFLAATPVAAQEIKLEGPHAASAELRTRDGFAKLQVDCGTHSRLALSIEKGSGQGPGRTKNNINITGSDGAMVQTDNLALTFPQDLCNGNKPDIPAIGRVLKTALAPTPP
ncbi:MAG TPA: hypothetical protein VMV79_03010 [Alphaproteobacteria bacterium]|nr:hypothetical protein [Alphaproteobacteria bacterium]